MERETVLNHFEDLLWTLPVFLYAETHYRFRYFFSILRKHEPEVIADAPHRIDPSQDIPLLILAKDAHRFPATISSVRVVVRRDGRTVRETELLREPVDLSTPMWWNVYQLERNGISGWVEIDVQIQLTTSGKTRAYSADNHRTSSHAPLRVYLSEEPLPKEQGMYFGDAHTHSDRTDDQVEFGVPIAAAVRLSKPLGLSFFCVADHSYDLDDAVDDFSSNDPAIPKWTSLLDDIQKHNNQASDFAVIQGEEISCRNGRGQNVHLLLFGNNHFFPGSGDGAEHWLRTRSEHSITEVLDQKLHNAPAFAAHPLEPVSLLQRLLLGRGTWSFSDFSSVKLAGIQFANGIRNKGFLKGYRAWVAALLAGKRVYCLAGNDAHGNFNRFRQIGVPFMKIREHNHQLFGKMRTAVFLNDQPNQSAFLRSLTEGSFVITDGPVMNIRLSEVTPGSTSIGSNLVGSAFDFTLSVHSSKEFGTIKEVRVLLGTIGTRSESVFLSEKLVDTYAHTRSLTMHVTEPMYLRAEAFTSEDNESDGFEHFCYTNPIWLTPPLLR